MTEGVLLALGGVGLFLLGMYGLTEGLKGLAGSSLRRTLARFTHSPISGVATGAVTTAIIQSSSATTLATVGFVSAGLITFPQAIGIIFGANIGTTMTGWIVAILGFQLHLGQVALPLVFVGALAHLALRGRLQQAGWALAGFSLLFIGIDMLQQGMTVFEGLVTPENFPRDTVMGRLLLVLVGVVATVITQSSSAGLAAALAAIGAGAISLPQAAAMVIGMNIGTTFTAILGTLGGSTATMRTGLAHVMFNVITGVIAFLLLTPYFLVIGRFSAGLTAGDNQILLVAFHTGFNIMGVLIFLPFSRQFARLIEKLVPEHGPHLTRHLDDTLLSDPAAATDALVATINDIANDSLALLVRLLDDEPDGRYERNRLASIGEALELTHQFAQQVRTDRTNLPLNARHIAAMHALDHLTRLHARLGMRTEIKALPDDKRLWRLAKILRMAANRALDAAEPGDVSPFADRVRGILRDQRHSYRARTIETAAVGSIETNEALERLDAIRWLHRVSYHVWRITVHLGEARTPMPAAPATPPAEPSAPPTP